MDATSQNSDILRLQELFVRWAGMPCTDCVPIAGGGGSSRRYFRLSAAGVSCIGTVASDQCENEAFFAFSRHLHDRNIHVPLIYLIDDDRCHYLQQDLGDRTLYSMLLDKRRAGLGFDSQMLSLYRQVLADLHAIQVAGRDADFSLAVPRPAFDQRAMLWDLDYFKYYFLKLAGIPFDENRLNDDFLHFIDTLLQADCTYFMYRDFQGRNIMVGDTLYYIDYQGARRGAAQYDVASLLYSAKSDIPEPVRADLLRYYVDLHADPCFMDHFWHYLLIRIMQTLGAYGFRGLYQHKPYFIESIPLALKNLRSVLDFHPLPDSYPELERVWNVLANTDIFSQTDATKPAAGEANQATLTVSIQSFSYKQGLPSDPSGNGGGHIFDCRALPNPGRLEQFRPLTGRDRPVVEFLQEQPAVDDFLLHAEHIVCQSVDKYLERRFTHLSVAFGCTGGRHRSVYCAENLALRLQRKYGDKIRVLLSHREQE